VTSELTPLGDSAALDAMGPGRRPALYGWLWARVCVGFGFVLANLLARRVELPDGRLHLREGLLTWDGSFYRLIAEVGYNGATSESARFFPLYPSFGRVLGPLFGGRPDVVLVLVANVAALAAGILLWRLANEVLGEQHIADRAAWMLALWPAAFVLVFAYAEGLFIVAVVAALLALHRRSFALAGLAGLGAGLIRPVGLLLVVPVLVEAFVAWRGNEDDSTRPPPRLLAVLAGVLGPVAGTGIALAWISAASGSGWAAPITLQRQLRAGFHEPVSRLISTVVDVVSGDMRDLPNLAFALLGIGLLIVSIRRRQPWSWVSLSAVTLVVLLSANNIDSLGRYLLGAVPLVIALAQWADRPWRSRAIGVLGSLGVVGCTAVALLGRMIP